MHKPNNLRILLVEERNHLSNILEDLWIKDFPKIPLENLTFESYKKNVPKTFES